MARYQSKQLFSTYYARWIHLYKEGVVHPVILRKYENTLDHIKHLAPNLHLTPLGELSSKAARLGQRKPVP